MFLPLLRSQSKSVLFKVIGFSISPSKRMFCTTKLQLSNKKDFYSKSNIQNCENSDKSSGSSINNSVNNSDTNEYENSQRNDFQDIVDQEMLRYDYEDFTKTSHDSEKKIKKTNPHEAALMRSPIPLKRGKTGVFDIEEIITLILSEGVQDECVIQVPAELCYADYLVIATCKSKRHLQAVAQYTLKLFKAKRTSSDPVTVKIEGGSGVIDKDWHALDLGNIVLHLFLHEARQKYDIETLWSVGAEFDDKTLEQESRLEQLMGLNIHSDLQNFDNTAPT